MQGKGHYKGHFAVQGHSRSPTLVPIESSYMRVINTNLYLLSCTVSGIWPPKAQKSLYLATPLVFKPPTEGFPWDDLSKILRECQRMAKVPYGEEKLPKISTG